MALTVFDNNFKPDKVNRIALSYHRLKKIKQDASSFENYDENLIIDRNAGTLEHTQRTGDESSACRKYYAPKGVSAFLDGLKAYQLFKNIEGSPEDAVYDPAGRKDYIITIDYKKSPQKTISGTFDKNGLPEDYASFIKAVSNFMKRFGTGEIFNSAIYSRPIRKNGELIFCSVTFGTGGRSYYYLTDDDSLEAGDLVIVPAGEDNHEASARIVRIDYFPPEGPPLPLDKVKRVIRRSGAEPPVN